MNTIAYEEKRLLIKKVIKQNLSLNFSEIIILDKLLMLNKEKVDLSLLRQALKLTHTPISTQLNHLIELGFFNKLRGVQDERCIYLFDINLIKIKATIEQYHVIVTSIINA